MLKLAVLLFCVALGACEDESLPEAGEPCDARDRCGAGAVCHAEIIIPGRIATVCLPACDSIECQRLGGTCGALGELCDLDPDACPDGLIVEWTVNPAAEYQCLGPT